MQTSSTSLSPLTAFAGFQRIAHGPRASLLRQLRAMTQEPDTLIRIFDDATGTRLEFDLRPEAADEPEAPAPVAEVESEAEAPPAPRTAGRPKLGVVAREVTLLPRHWEWLARQQGGASVALRKLVEDARRAHEGRDAIRAAREAAYRFMAEMAGDLPGFEEATRALFADDKARFDSLVAPWPDDVKHYLDTLAASSWKQTT